MKAINNFIEEIEKTIEQVETKVKEELATKGVITAQKKAFKAQ